LVDGARPSSRRRGPHRLLASARPMKRRRALARQR
jgi:hypothetical protein